MQNDYMSPEKIRICFDLPLIKDLNRFGFDPDPIDQKYPTLRVYGALKPRLQGIFERYFGPAQEDIYASTDLDVRFLTANSARMTIGCVDNYWQRQRGEAQEMKEEFYVELEGIDLPHPLVEELRQLKVRMEGHVN